MAGPALSFNSLSATLSSAIDEILDPRNPSIAMRYSVKDAVMGAFSCFFMQSESFLDYQRQLDSRSGQDNAQSLFGL
ncbi:MAG: ISNCY family transposase, partial [Phormidesmis sp.]